MPLLGADAFQMAQAGRERSLVLRIQEHLTLWEFKVYKPKALPRE